MSQKLNAQTDLLELVLGVQLIIAAGLYAQLDQLAAQIRGTAATATDVWLLSRVCAGDCQPESLSIAARARYQHARRAQAGAHSEARRWFGRGPVAISTRRQLGKASDTLRRLQPTVAMWPDHQQSLWLAALQQVVHDVKSHPLLLGFAMRTLLDAQVERGRLLQRQFAAQLSRSTAVLEVGDFLEGFLYSSAQVLLHEVEILMLLNNWLATVDILAFRDLLPALRRTFAQFSRAERRKLKAAVEQVSPAAVGFGGGLAERRHDNRPAPSSPAVALLGFRPKPVARIGGLSG